MVLTAALGRSAAAQGNLSTQGFGYPPGEVSTGALGAGGAFGEFDPVSALNPAALVDWGRAGAHFQYQPEFRSVSTPSGTDHTTTVRFPLLAVGVPIGSRFVIGLSLATLLDRSWQTTQTQQLPLGDTVVTSVETFRSTGGISDVRLAGGWSPVSWLRAGIGLHVFTGRNQIALSRTFPDTTVIKALPFSDTSTFSYVGAGVSAGVVLRPTPVLAVAGSLRLGGQLRVHRNDSLQTRANVPPRAGASIRYDGLPGVSLALRGDWEGWTRMSGLGSPSLQPADAWGVSAGADVSGPRLGADREITLRLGGRSQTLPFRANGAIVRENAFSGGFGVPFGADRAALDLAVEREVRSASVQGVSEGAWTLSVGLTLRP
jgi:hypothetical protein